MVLRFLLSMAKSRSALSAFRLVVEYIGYLFKASPVARSEASSRYRKMTWTPDHWAAIHASQAAAVHPEGL